jgi:uncharacterized protein with FMN-binding domain
MRRASTALMCALTGVVVGVSYTAGTRGKAPAQAVAAAGVVQPSASSAPPSVTPTATPSASPAPRGAAAPRPTRSRTSVVPTAVPTPPATRATTTPVPTPTRSPAATSTTVNGAAADTRYGPVQVQITVRGGRIVKADAIVYPQGDRRDREINSWAVPQLNQETLDAQSAQIDTVSGATYTSDGYRQSLQSALDAAHQAGAL